jgi:hypothetical protein
MKAGRLEGIGLTSHADPLVLDQLTHPQRQAFKRMALHPDDVRSVGQMKCITATADALVAAGLAARADGAGGARCTARRSRISWSGSSSTT